MKKIAICIVILSILTLTLIACDNEGQKQIITVGPPENLTTVGDGIVALDNISKLQLEVSYSDGSKQTIPVTMDMISGYDNSKKGLQSVKISYQSYSATVDIIVADKIISNSQELSDAVKSQKDGEYWYLTGGTYDLQRDDETEVNGQSGWYFAITANNITVDGYNYPTITSTTLSENGAHASQNLVTVFGNNTTLTNINFVSKREVNKVIEIFGDDFTMSNCTVIPPEGILFAGSVYFNEYAGKTATISNTVLEKGRISLSGCDSTSTINLSDTKIYFANASAIDSDFLPEYDGNYEVDYWGLYNPGNAVINAQNCLISVSSTFTQSPDYAEFENTVPEGMEIKIVE